MNHNLNLVGLAVNIARAYEIAKFGGHDLVFIPSTTGNVTSKDVSLFCKFYGETMFYRMENPDMTVEIAYSPADILNVLSQNSRAETLEQINKRITETRKIQVDSTLNKSCQSLLKSAIEKLDLGITDTIQIIKVAQTIANLDQCEGIKIEHLAEAIQYKSVKSA